MQNESQIFDVLITHEDLILLQKQNQQLKQIVQSLREDKDELNQIINGLMDDIRKHAPFVEQGIELQKKTRSLSKYVLKLMNLAFTLREKIEKTSDSGRTMDQNEKYLKCMKELHEAQKKIEQLEVENDRANDSKQKIQEQLDVTRQMQSQVQEKLIQYRQYIATLEMRLKEREETNHQELQLKAKKSEKDLIDNQWQKNLLELDVKKLQASLADTQARLNQKDQVILDLKRRLAPLDSEIKQLKQQLQQRRICQNWKLSQGHVEKVNQRYGNNDEVVNQLRKRVQQLTEQQEKYDYLFENERNFIEQHRKKLEEKEKNIILREKEIKQKEADFQRKNQKFDRSFQQRQESLQSQYINKIKSLKEFGACSQCEKQKEKYGKVIAKLKSRLEKADRNNKQKQDMIDYVNEILGSLRKEQGVTLQQLIDTELGELMARWCNSKQTAKEELEKKEQQWINLICEKLQRVQNKLNQAQESL